MVFFGNMLPLIWLIFGLIEVVCFFIFTSKLSIQWLNFPEKIFIKKIFRTALTIRILYVIFSYFFYRALTDEVFEFFAADSIIYHELALRLKDLISRGAYNTYVIEMAGRISDMGYPTYLSLIYTIFSNSILLARIIKGVLSAYMCILIYKIATRNFGAEVGRIAGIMAMLLPNFIYYCGLHVKETEMLFLTVVFLERADFLIRTRKFNLMAFLWVMISGLILFTFRTVLGATAFIALIAALVFSSKRIINSSRQFTIVLFLFFAGLVFTGGAIYNEIDQYWENRDRNQNASMAYRETRPFGNSFAKYGKTAVFAPTILIAPFPTLVNIEGQENLMMMNGSYYVRNIYAFFVLISLVVMIKTHQIRDHALILTFVASYLAVLSMSGFALSERFHLPVVPFLLILSAYGISQINKMHRKWFIPYLILVGIIILGWNWFKLAGRGLL
jgi:hypothetical protein